MPRATLRDERTNVNPEDSVFNGATRRMYRARLNAPYSLSLQPYGAFLFLSEIREIKGTARLKASCTAAFYSCDFA